MLAQDDRIIGRSDDNKYCPVCQLSVTTKNDIR
jgi:hypothetical protein